MVPREKQAEESIRQKEIKVDGNYIPSPNIPGAREYLKTAGINSSPQKKADYSLNLGKMITGFFKRLIPKLEI